ncbi:MAG: iron dependent repressor, metal binding and dimerization domain protein [Lachnospiraceae bacterium]|nr:iron dependent repressor, metal binding and dimerization domain protein [Lachnospiraceae bacterium]
MISVDASGFISLTPKGKETAETIYERHIVLSECLIALGDSPETAAQDACRMEHVISAESFRHLKNYYKEMILSKEV